MSPTPPPWGNDIPVGSTGRLTSWNVTLFLRLSAALGPHKSTVHFVFRRSRVAATTVYSRVWRFPWECRQRFYNLYQRENKTHHITGSASYETCLFAIFYTAWERIVIKMKCICLREEKRKEEGWVEREMSIHLSFVPTLSAVDIQPYLSWVSGLFLFGNGCFPLLQRVSRGWGISPTAVPLLFPLLQWLSSFGWRVWPIGSKLGR